MTDDERRDAAAEQADLPSGAAMRAWVRRTGSRHSTAGPMDLFGDIYTAVFGFALATTMIVAGSRSAGLAVRLHGGPAPSNGPVVLDRAWVAALLAIAATACVTGLAARLGPTSVSSAQGTWLLALPVDRRSLLRVAALRWPVVAAVLGGPLGLGAALAMGLRTSPATVAGAVVLGAALTGGAVLTVGALQPDRRAHRVIRTLADGALAAVPVGGIVLAAAGLHPPDAAGTGLLVTAVALAVAALGLAVLVDRRAEHVPDASLRALGQVGGEASAAVQSLDTRALGRALSQDAEPNERRRSLSLNWLGSLNRRGRARPGAGRPSAVLVTADALLLLRSPRHLAQIVAAVCLPVVALLLPGPSGALVAVAVLAAAGLAGSAAAEGARRAEFNPVLDGLLPMSHAQVRLWRLAVPVGVVTLWSLPVFAALAWRHPAGGVMWIVLGLATAPAWGAAAVRSAYRALPDYSAPLVATPGGALPSGAMASALKGADVAVIGAVPAIVAVVTGGLSPLLVSIQVLFSLICVQVSARPRSTRPR